MLTFEKSDPIYKDNVEEALSTSPNYYFGDYTYIDWHINRN